MSSRAVIYTGPPRRDLNLRTHAIFARGELPEHLKEAIKTDPGLGNQFTKLSLFRLRPAPGSRAFAGARILRTPLKPYLRRRL
jgi:hypothetical protein